MPTKILSKPRYVHNKFGGGKIMEIVCDDGVYNSTTLAKALGMATSSLLGRAHRHGWMSEKLFDPKCVKGKRFSEDFEQNEGNDEWRKLGKSVRSYNLKPTKHGVYDGIYSHGCDNVIGA